jgi:hypothetical protein
MEDQHKLAPSLSLRSQVIAGHDHSSNKCSVFLISRLGAMVMSNRSALQPPNPDRAREQPMRTGPVGWLSGVQVAEGKVRHDSRQDRRGPHFTPHYSGPPPIKGRMARGLWNASSAVDLGRWTLAIQICLLLTLMHIRAPV